MAGVAARRVIEPAEKSIRNVVRTFSPRVITRGIALRSTDSVTWQHTKAATEDIYRVRQTVGFDPIKREYHLTSSKLESSKGVKPEKKVSVDIEAASIEGLEKEHLDYEITPTRDAAVRNFFEVVDDNVSMGGIDTAQDGFDSKFRIALKALNVLIGPDDALAYGKKLEVFDPGFVEESEIVPKEHVDAELEHIYKHSVLMAPVVIQSSPTELAVGDGNRVAASYRLAMGKGVFQVSGEATKLEMRPRIISQASLEEKLTDGSMKEWRAGEEVGMFFVEDRLTDKVYIPSSDLMKDKTLVEQITVFRELFPDSEKRLFRSHLDNPETDRLVQVFEIHDFPGLGLPAETFNVIADAPRIIFSGGLNMFVPNERGVRPIESTVAFEVDQTILAENGFKVKGREFPEGIVILAHSPEEAGRGLAVLLHGTSDVAAAPRPRSGSPVEGRKSPLGYSLQSTAPLKRQTYSQSSRHISSASPTEFTGSTKEKKKPVVAVLYNSVQPEVLVELYAKYDVEILKPGDKVPNDVNAVVLQNQALTDEMLTKVFAPQNLVVLNLGDSRNVEDLSNGVILQMPDSDRPLSYVSRKNMVRNGCQNMDLLIDGYVPSNVEFRGITEQGFVDAMSLDAKSPLDGVSVRQSPTSNAEVVRAIVSALNIKPSINIEASVSARFADTRLINGASSALLDEVDDMARHFLTLTRDQHFFHNAEEIAQHPRVGIGALLRRPDDSIQIVTGGDWSRNAYRTLSKEFPNVKSVHYSELPSLDSSGIVHITPVENGRVLACTDRLVAQYPRSVVSMFGAIGALDMPKASFISGGWGFSKFSWAVVDHNSLSPKFEKALTWKSDHGSSVTAAVKISMLQQLIQRYDTHANMVQNQKKVAGVFHSAIRDTLNFQVLPLRGEYAEGDVGPSPTDCLIQYRPGSAVPFGAVNNVFKILFPDQAQLGADFKQNQLMVCLMGKTEEEAEIMGDRFIQLDEILLDIEDQMASLPRKT